MPRVRRFFSFLVAVALGACTGPRETLGVKQFVLRDQERDTDEDPMVRMEKSRRLHGAVSMTERRQRLGQYYTMVWHDPNGVGKGPVEVVFEYQQGATASRVKCMTKSFPSSDASGVAEFAVIGDDYFSGGKVLAWRVSVRRDGQELASRQSYLWR
jgi:hypothetical protein